MQEDDGEKIVKNAEHGVNKQWVNIFQQNDPDWNTNEKKSRWILQNIIGSHIRNEYEIKK